MSDADPELGRSRRIRTAVLATAAGALLLLLPMLAVLWFLLSDPDADRCEKQALPLAAQMEAFLRKNSGQVTYGPPSVSSCESVPGVLVSLNRQTGPLDVNSLYAALRSAGCVRVQKEFDPEARSCTLPSGKRFDVAVGRSDGWSGYPKRGESFSVSGSIDFV